MQKANNMTYILVDTANTFFRARHVVRGDLDTKVGMAFHITLGSIRKAWADFEGAHVVFCLEGRSWRKDFYEPYKRNRSDARAAQTESQQEEDKVFWEMFDEWKEFVTNKTNCSVLEKYHILMKSVTEGSNQQKHNNFLQSAKHVRARVVLFFTRKIQQSCFEFVTKLLRGWTS